ncbi:MAG: F0F1 ATP synthase subunit A [Phycisphaerae bacterium]|nr:F0F1 ATP synthase subunit A [Phycisphaerae bacterium]
MTGLELLASSNPISHVAEVGIKIGGVTVLSNQIIMQLTAAALLLWLMPKLTRRIGTGDKAPSGGLNALEAVCQYFRKEVAEPALGKHTDRFITYIWSVFFFILFCNLLGLLPLPAISEVLFGHAYLGGTSTGNVWTTATLAACSLVMIVVNGIRLQGMAYVAHFCPGPLWLAPILVPVEILGLVAKIFALAVRLFANMIAGHILLAVLLSFIGAAGVAFGFGAGYLAIGITTLLGSVAINLLEVFVAFLQAFIFTFLTTLFIGQAVNIEHHGDEHEHEHGGEEHAAHAH